MKAATISVRAGIESDSQHGAVVPPIHLSSNFAFAGPGEKRPYDYTRSGNPTRDLLGRAIADLEGACGGVVTATGMATVSLVCQLLRPGDCLLAPQDCYGGTWRLLDAWARRGAFELHLRDLHCTAGDDPLAGLRPRLIWVETPSNPLLRITDIANLAQRAHRLGALLVVDNTFLSPALQNPIALGADIVVHSTTKYLNGHSDVVGGAVVTADPALLEELAWWANCMGVTGSPFDAFLSLRGLRTLLPRMRAHQENARRLVEVLDTHPAVAQVYYPGLVEHPGHALAARQQCGFGGMISFDLEGGYAAACSLLRVLEHFSLAESLGGVESLAAHPASMTHAAMSAEVRAAAGIGEGLVRLSVGIEDADDLCADLRRGLDAAASTGAGVLRASTC